MRTLFILFISLSSIAQVEITNFNYSDLDEMEQTSCYMLNEQAIWYFGETRADLFCMFTDLNGSEKALMFWRILEVNRDDQLFFQLLLENEEHQTYYLDIDLVENTVTILNLQEGKGTTMGGTVNLDQIKVMP